MAAAGRGRKGSGNGATLAAAAALAAMSGAVVLLSRRPELVGPGRSPLVIVTLLLAGGLAWAFSIRRLERTSPAPSALAVVIVFSLLVSGAQLLSRPVQKAPVNRQLLDGGVTACGENPYLLSPSEQGRSLSAVGALRAFATTGGDGGPCLTGDERWNAIVAGTDQAERRSSYGPLAHYWFAGAVELGGPSIDSLRVSYLVAELALLVCLAALLLSVGVSPLMVAVVGWSPLVFLEVFNSARYEIVPAMMITVAGLALVSRRFLLAGLALGLTASAKLPALALMPLWLRAVPAGKRVPAALAMLVGVALPWIPFYDAVGSFIDEPGAFAVQWSAGAPLFKALTDLASVTGLDGTSSALAAVALVAMMALAVCALYPLDDDPAAALRGSVLVMIVILLAGPTAGAWQFVWLLPLVAIEPRASSLALLVMVPLFHADALFAGGPLEGHRGLLGLVALAPFAVLAIGELLYRNRSSSRGRMRSAAEA